MLANLGYKERVLAPAFAEGDVSGYALLREERGLVWETYFIDIYEPATLAVRESMRPLPFPFGIDQMNWGSITNHGLEVELVGTWDKVRVYLDGHLRPQNISYFDYGYVDAHENHIASFAYVKPWEQGDQVVFDVPLSRGYGAFVLEYKLKG